MTESAPTKLNPTALTLEHAARVLTGASGQVVTVDMLRRELDRGAPHNPDGTINVVEYAAWLVKEMGRGH